MGEGGGAKPNVSQVSVEQNVSTEIPEKEEAQKCYRKIYIAFNFIEVLLLFPNMQLCATKMELLNYK